MSVSPASLPINRPASPSAVSIALSPQTPAVLSASPAAISPGLASDTLSTTRQTPKFGNAEEVAPSEKASDGKAPDSKNNGGILGTLGSVVRKATAGVAGLGVGLMSNAITLPTAGVLVLLGFIPGLQFLWGAALGVAVLGPIAAGALTARGLWK